MNQLIKFTAFHLIIIINIVAHLPYNKTVSIRSHNMNKADQSSNAHAAAIGTGTDFFTRLPLDLSLYTIQQFIHRAETLLLLQRVNRHFKHKIISNPIAWKNSRLTCRSRQFHHKKFYFPLYYLSHLSITQEPESKKDIDMEQDDYDDHSHALNSAKCNLLLFPQLTYLAITDNLMLDWQNQWFMRDGRVFPQALKTLVIERILHFPIWDRVFDPQNQMSEIQLGQHCEILIPQVNRLI